MERSKREMGSLTEDLNLLDPVSEIDARIEKEVERLATEFKVFAQKEVRQSINGQITGTWKIDAFYRTAVRHNVEQWVNLQGYCIEWDDTRAEWNDFTSPQKFTLAPKKQALKKPLSDYISWARIWKVLFMCLLVGGMTGMLGTAGLYLHLAGGWPAVVGGIVLTVAALFMPVGHLVFYLNDLIDDEKKRQKEGNS